ncbi:FAD:protein FMN transferase [Kiritimatiella glycovorans]|uniref:FAD:protein FMN transferase n=1 Tax=Kiritimatiella glycovorans TaxID=1307763 RepID=A0A0G3EDJ6_9BACT|nr:FAD:protein FMN transferase [Kiritimatiella glycovorans]AKJ64388.1 ApbE family protein [Kiritimatiella glycovorans]
MSTELQPVEIRREAMNTVFAFHAYHDRPAYARHALTAAMEEVAWAEERLSRFLESSDLGRIAAAGTGEVLRVDPITFEVLRVSLKLYEASGGAFDIGCRQRPRIPLTDLIALEEGGLCVRVLADGPVLDAGGIGKGAALDRAAAVLREDWDLENALLCGGTSTILGIGAPPGEAGWRPLVEGAVFPGPVLLRDRAFSASGVNVQGEHIQPEAEIMCRRAWAGAPGAATADGLSTALMLLPREDAIRLLEEDRDWFGFAEYEPGVITPLKEPSS